MREIFWSVGDKSSDIHAAGVIKRLKEISPEIRHIGIGGYQMQKEGLKALFPFTRFSVMGFFEVIQHLPFFIKVEREVKRYLQENKPDLVILLDYPGLNFRIANIAYYLHIRIMYYICPQFWAWRHSRVYQMERFCDKVACIFPFEKELLDMHNIDSEYVGHPVVEEINIQLSKKEFSEFYGLDLQKKWISFFPGSRHAEVQSLLPIYIETIKKMKKTSNEYEFLVSKSSNLHHKAFMYYLKDQHSVKVIDGYNYELIKYSDFLVVKSGTTTMEVGCVGTPFLIVYKANPLSYMIAKRLIQVKYIGMPNIILNKPLVPELIQDDVTPEKIIEIILYYLGNEKEYEQYKRELSELMQQMGTECASENVARMIMEMLERR